VTGPETPEEEPEGGIQDTAGVVCPYCGEEVTVLLDPGGGRDQAYVEDCEVCCRPWAVRVRYTAEGEATVEVRISG
jgi:transposase-like protein